MLNEAPVSIILNCTSKVVLAQIKSKLWMIRLRTNVLTFKNSYVITVSIMYFNLGVNVTLHLVHAVPYHQ